MMKKIYNDKSIFRFLPFWEGLGLLISLHCSVLTASAQSFFNDLDVTARAAYAIGGTAPLPMPASIRHLDRFPLKPNVDVGIDVRKPVAGRWGVLTGLHFEGKGMETDARVKAYHEVLTRGGETLEGLFTGSVVTRVRQWMFTVPLQATFDISRRVRMRLGPSVSVVTAHGFDGSAYNGYLRVGDPTGPKVELGSEEGERGTYDFSDEMRRTLWAVDLGADWQLAKRFGLYADLSWGLHGIHNSHFRAIEQTLYPIYGKIGVSYKIK